MKVFFPVLALSLLALAPGCRPKAEKAGAVPVLSAPPAGNPHGEGMGKKESTVVVPANQKGKWIAIKFVATNLANKKETTLQAALGGDVAIPGSSLSLHVENILADFTMGDGVITSKSDSLGNPAAQVILSQDGKQIWKGWLFSKFPDTHAFSHEQVSLKLVDLVAAK